MFTYQIYVFVDQSLWMELLKMDEISDVLDDSDEISEVDIADINWCECCPSSSQEGSLKSLQVIKANELNPKSNYLPTIFTKLMLTL